MIAALKAIGRWIHPRVPGGLSTGHYQGAAAALFSVAGISGFGHMHSTPAPPPVAQVYIPSQAPTVPPPSAISQVPLTVTPGAITRVHGVVTRDTGVNISSAINQASAYYGFSPVGFAALIGTESGIRQYAPHYPIAGAGYCDYSFGLVQITSCTAGSLGVGNGSMSAANISYVQWYEESDPIREVWLGAKLLHEFQVATCVDFTPLYAVWNQGPGYGCGAWQYTSPAGMAGSNYQNYFGWWRYAWATFAYSYTPPPPPKFPATFYEKYRTAHHLSPVPYRDASGQLSYGARLWWHADWKSAGGVTRPERWDAHNHVMREDYQNFKAWWWPGHSHWRVEWRRRVHSLH